MKSITFDTKRVKEYIIEKLLLVCASSSVWIHQLQFLKADIIDNVNRALGKKLVEDIKFKVGNV